MLAFSLPTWLERLFGHPPAESGEGTQWSYASDWTLPPWATLLIVAFSAAFAGYFYYQQRASSPRPYLITMAALRFLALAAVLFMLASVVLTPARTGLPYVVVLVDVSASMGNVDTYTEEEHRAEIKARLEKAELDKLTRLNLAKALLLEEDGKLLREIEKRYKLKVYFFDQDARDLGGDVDEVLAKVRRVSANGKATGLGVAVRAALSDLRGTPPSAVIVLTDGVNTEGEPLLDAARFARDKNVPLFTVGLGSDEPLRNLKLSDLTVDEVVFVDDIIAVECQLSGPGFQDREVEVVLKEKGREEKLASQKVKVPAQGRPLKVRLRHRITREQWLRRKKSGENFARYEFVVEVELLEKEKDRDDNVVYSRPVKVVDEKIAVLLVQSYPNFEFRYLKNMLERDESIALTTVLQESDPDWARIDQSARREHVFPVKAEDLNKFDVLLFGDVNPEFLSRKVMRNIVDFVNDRGRSIVFIAGPKYTPLAFRHSPLAALFPIDLGTAVAPEAFKPITDGFRPRPTALGVNSPHMQLGDTVAESVRYWSGLKEMYWFLEVHRLKPAARVLAEHPVKITAGGRKFPMFIEQFYGAGRVLFHASDDTWRWRWRLRDDVLFRRYWVQTLRYLSRSKLVGEGSAELSVDRDDAEYQRGDTVRLRVRFRDETRAPVADDGVTVMVERRGGKTERLKLRRDRNQSDRGVFSGVFRHAPTGNYHAWVANPSIPGASGAADFAVKPPPGEAALSQMNSDGLKRAAGVMTTGRYYTFDNAGELLAHLPKGRQVVVVRMDPFPLWNWPPLPAIVLLLLVGEWVMRKRKGLL